LQRKSQLGNVAILRKIHLRMWQKGACSFLKGSCEAGSPQVLAKQEAYRFLRSRKPTGSCEAGSLQVLAKQEAYRFLRSRKPTGSCEAGSLQVLAKQEAHRFLRSKKPVRSPRRFAGRYCVSPQQKFPRDDNKEDFLSLRGGSAAGLRSSTQLNNVAIFAEGLSRRRQKGVCSFLKGSCEAGSLQVLAKQESCKIATSFCWEILRISTAKVSSR